jgi:hypothetical protein
VVLVVAVAFTCFAFAKPISTHANLGPEPICPEGICK